MRKLAFQIAPLPVHSAIDLFRPADLTARQMALKTFSGAKAAPDARRNDNPEEADRAQPKPATPVVAGKRPSRPARRRGP
ncbi:hypothetical protein [Azospirillum doebereinerae]